jgi:hypothetical protein
VLSLVELFEPDVSPLFLRSDTSSDIDIVDLNFNRPNKGIFIPVGHVKEYLVETEEFWVVFFVVLCNAPVVELYLLLSDIERLEFTLICIRLRTLKLNDRNGL